MTENNLYALFDKPTSQNLESNRRGSLTPEQRSALEQMAKNQRTLFAFWSTLILGVAGFMLFFLWQIEGEDGSLSLLALVTVGIVVLGVILLLVFLSAGDFFFIFPLDDIRNGQVEAVIGQVAWMGSRYRMISDARKLRFLTYGRTLPPPGDYRFYCLARSGLVVMAEALTVVSQPDDLLLAALARAHRFSMEDLKTNREGALSGGQDLRLLGSAFVPGALILFSVLGVVLAIQGKVFGPAPTTYNLIGVICVFLLLRLTWDIVNVLVDLWVARVNYTDGLVTRHVHHARNTRYYTYQLNGFRFRVTLAAYNALLEGRQYRVYFVPRSRRLVAIEPIQ